MSDRALDAMSFNFEMDRSALQLALVRFCTDLLIPNEMKVQLSSLPWHFFQQGAAQTNKIKPFQIILISYLFSNQLPASF